jgi:hypothetical protein
MGKREKEKRRRGGKERRRRGGERKAKHVRGG